MPWTADEEKRVKALEEIVQSLRTELRRSINDLESASRRVREEDQHERSAFIASATRAIENVVAGQLAKVDQVFAINREQSETLEEIRKELELSAKERNSRAARELADAAISEREEKAKKLKAADRKHNLATWGLLVPLIAIVVGAIATAIASHFH